MPEDILFPVMQEQERFYLIVKLNKAFWKAEIQQSKNNKKKFHYMID